MYEERIQGMELFTVVVEDSTNTVFGVSTIWWERVNPGSRVVGLENYREVQSGRSNQDDGDKTKSEKEGGYGRKERL